MTQSRADMNGSSGRIVAIDPRLVRIMAIDLLDDEPVPDRRARSRLDRPLDPRTFQVMAIGDLDEEPALEFAPRIAA